MLSGVLDSHDISDKLSYEIVNVSYDIEKELSDKEDILEFDSYSVELREGKYRNMAKIYDSFVVRGIDKDKV